MNKCRVRKFHFTYDVDIKSLKIHYSECGWYLLGFPQSSQKVSKLQVEIKESVSFI